MCIGDEKSQQNEQANHGHVLANSLVELFICSFSVRKPLSILRQAVAIGDGSFKLGILLKGPPFS
jgi:hypothetical protein